MGVSKHGALYGKMGKVKVQLPLLEKLVQFSVEIMYSYLENNQKIRKYSR